MQKGLTLDLMEWALQTDTPFFFFQNVPWLEVINNHWETLIVMKNVFTAQDCTMNDPQMHLAICSTRSS